MFLQGDCLEVLKTLPSESVNCCVTSPPYWNLRDYQFEGQLGLEKTPQEYVDKMVEIFREVKRVLKYDATLWLNLGDSYCGSRSNSGNTKKIANKQESNKGSVDRLTNVWSGDSIIKPKDLIGIPWKVAFALQADGYYLRQDIIWHKKNPMPESMKDRCTKAHEYIFLLSKSSHYYFDQDAIKEPCKYKIGAGYANVLQGGFNDKGIIPGSGQRSFRAIRDYKNKRSVWTVASKPFKGAHYATFNPDLIEPCVLAGCPEGGVVLDPFSGAGTTALVALRNKRKHISIELNPEYIKMSEDRIAKEFSQQEMDL